MMSLFIFYCASNSGSVLSLPCSEDKTVVVL